MHAVTVRRTGYTGDVGEYQRLMDIGARSNLAENFTTTETAYRAALALQHRVLDAKARDTVNALMGLALQLSDQGRFAEADALFAQAGALAPRPIRPVRVMRRGRC